MQPFPRIPAKVSWYVFDRWHQFLFSSKCSLLKESLTVLNTETSILLCFWKCPFCLKIHLIDLFISCSGEVLGRLHILQSRHFTGIFFQGTVLTREILPLRRRQPLVLFSFVGPPQTEQLCHLGRSSVALSSEGVTGGSLRYHGLGLHAAWHWVHLHG